MADTPQFSPAQTRAIHDGAPQYQSTGTIPGHNVLVSASAGSGKTTVLVERILTQILAGGDIARMLVVTFTKAAAAEMKTRIEAKLKSTLTTMQASSDADHAIRRHLAQQIMRVSSAPISTLDAFALQVVQQYYYVLDLDPGFRILADQAESRLIQESVWDTVREDAFVHDDSGEFAALNDNFASGWHDDQLATIVFNLYTFAQTMPDPAAWVAKFADDFDGSLAADGPLMSRIREMALPALDQMCQQLKQAQRLIADQTVTEAAEGEASPAAAIIEGDLERLTGFIDVLKNGSYTAVHNAWASLGKWPNWKGAAKKKFLSDIHPEFMAASEKAHQLRGDIAGATGQFAKIMGPLVQLDDATMTAAITKSRSLATTLSQVTQAFTEAYEAEKARRHALDFSDIEHLALKILTDTSVSKEVDVGAQYREAFDEVLVDEYQDINALQEQLLNAVSQPTPGNRFMVGDVKQSIYGFRLARPELFKAKYDHYAQPEADNETLKVKGEHISLAENFRSSANILDFTNLVFKQVMDNSLGDLDYSGLEMLKQGAQDYPQNFAPETEIRIYTNGEDEEEDARDKDEGQVDLVIARIQQMMADPAVKLFDRRLAKTLREQAQQQGTAYHPEDAMRRLRYRDITLLVPTRSQNDVISERFAVAGIPIVGSDSKGYFKTTELQVMLSLLKVIDNPEQEIPLVAILRSPIVGMSADELALIRLADKKIPYYDAVKVFRAQFDPATATALATRAYTKLDRFMTQLDGFRDLARDNRIVDLIWSIYEQTGYLDYVGGMPGGPQRQANLHALYERAAMYEQGDFKGLFAFVRFIEIMQQRDQDLDSPVTIDPDTDAVRVMTIHGSKGLQFPVVFLMNASHMMNAHHGDSPVIATDHGIGLPLVTSDTNMRIETPQLKAAKYERQLKDQAEAMRVLYVALTRAEQRLVIVGAAKSQEVARNTWAKMATEDKLQLSFNARLGAKSFLDLIGASIARHPYLAQRPDGVDIADVLANDATRFQVVFTTERPVIAPAQPHHVKVNESAMTIPTALDITNAFDNHYAYTAATQTTGFQAVSEIKQLFTDPSLIELNQAPTSRQQHRYSQPLADPQFMQTHANEKVTAASVGTATHALLQHLDLSGPLDEPTLRQTAALLVNRGVFSAAVYQRIQFAELVRFFNETALGKQLQANAKTVHREQPFSMLLPGATVFPELAGDDQDILVHGIMDAYFETTDGLILLDYKTDHIGPAGVNQLIPRYSGQLNLYRQALTGMTGQPVIASYLVALETGDVLAL